MFSFGHSGTSTSVDPDLERNPPPPPTIVYFPQNDVQLRSDGQWLRRPGGPPDLHAIFSYIAKPSDVKPRHLEALNLVIINDTTLEDFVPQASDGLSHLPPKTWGKGAAGDPQHSAIHYEVYAHSTFPLLSNGNKAPELDTFNRFVKELICDTDTGLRSIGKQKPKPGHPLPHFNGYRRFWTQLEMIASYWDTASDNYYVVDANDKGSGIKGGLRRKLSTGRRPSVDVGGKVKYQKYKGRRTSTGSKMPDHFRNDAVRAFVEPVAWAFGCQLANPRRIPQVQIKTLLVPVTQTAIVWRTPQDKGQSRRGILEGPILGIQCRGETEFMHDTGVAVIDAAREIAGLLLLAQERAREGKTDVIAGQGKWYVVKPRWGGGPGGEFGEAEGNKDTKPPATSGGRRHSTGSIPIRLGPNEEEMWKDLKPGPGLWERNMAYLAVGKERGAEFDSVFMISSLYHHISLVRLDVHPLYLEYLVNGQIPSQLPNSSWFQPKIKRTKWFDLLDPEDRTEAMRGLWGVLSYSMRTGQVSAPLGQRQKSEVSHAFSFRKKKYDVHTPDEQHGPMRSSSVNF